MLAFMKCRRRIAIGIGAAIALAILIAVWVQPALLKTGTLISLLTEEPPPRLPVPVEQVTPDQLADTWGAPRGTDRRHEGIDIFAPLGRPIMSTTKGVVFKVGEDNLGGHVVRVLGPGWQWHYYAHLDKFANITPGTIVEPGTVLGYVGNTGNAVGTPHHLHYGVYRFLGGPQNPYPMLAADQPSKKTTVELARARSHKKTKRLARASAHKPTKKLAKVSSHKKRDLNAKKHSYSKSLRSRLATAAH